MMFDLITRNRNNKNSLFPHNSLSDFFEPMTDWFNDHRGRLSADVVETDKEYEISVDLPGVSKDEINIEFTDGVLTVSCERTSTIENKLVQERRYGRFSRTFTLPHVEQDDIDAQLANGVLTLKITKKTDEKKKIDIKIRE